MYQVMDKIEAPSTALATQLRDDRGDLNGTSPAISPSLSSVIKQVSVALRVVKDQIISRSNTSALGFPLPSLLTVASAWKCIIEGRLRMTTSSARTISWRKRCQLLRSRIEELIEAGSKVSEMKETALKARLDAEARAEELKCALRKNEELSGVLEKQQQALALAEQATAREEQHIRNEVSLQREVQVLTEALSVLEGRLETLQLEAKKSAAMPQQSLGRSPSTSTISLSIMGESENNDSQDALASMLALRGAIVVGEVTIITLNAKLFIFLVFLILNSVC